MASAMVLCALDNPRVPYIYGVVVALIALFLLMHFKFKGR